MAVGFLFSFSSNLIVSNLQTECESESEHHKKKMSIETFSVGAEMLIRHHTQEVRRRGGGERAPKGVAPEISVTNRMKI